MSEASHRAQTRAEPRTERFQSWLAALLSVLLHVLVLLILLHDPPPTFAQSESAAGGRMKMEFIGKTSDPATKTPPSPPPSRAATPPSRPTPKKPTVQRKPATSPVQTTLVQQAADPVPDDAAAIPATTADDSWSMPSQSQRVTQQSKPPGNPPPSQNPAATWGRPPGMLDHDTAPTEDGLSDSDSTNPGNRRDMGATGPSLAIGGYNAYYEPRVEEKVRAWMAQGMKEFFIPLPGTRYYMVCDLDIVLRRGSGKCRALDPNDPEMKNVGDSREIINMLQVYKQGQLVWKGPGPYR